MRLPSVIVRWYLGRGSCRLLIVGDLRARLRDSERDDVQRARHGTAVAAAVLVATGLRAGSNFPTDASIMADRDALYMYLGFRVGIYDRARVADWVDQQVLARGVADGPLLELGFLLDKSDNDIEQLVLHLAEQAHGVAIGPRACAMLGRMVRVGELGGSTASTMLTRLPNGWLSQEDINRAYGVDDSYELAQSGEWGTLEEAQARLLEFTDEMARLSPPASE